MTSQGRLLSSDQIEPIPLENYLEFARASADWTWSNQDSLIKESSPEYAIDQDEWRKEMLFSPGINPRAIINPHANKL